MAQTITKPTGRANASQKHGHVSGKHASRKFHGITKPKGENQNKSKKRMKPAGLDIAD